MLLKIDNNNKINDIRPVSSVVSLVPSLTETIAALGAVNQLIGVTRFCTAPKEIRSQVAIVGGTKNFSIHQIEKLNPGCVVAVKEENNKELILELSKKLPVVLFDISYLNDVYLMLQVMGRLLNKEEEASLISEKIKLEFRKLKINQENVHKVLYLIWKNPWMAAGTDTFIGEMIRLAGFRNIVTGRYPEVDELIFLKSDVVLLSSEPYPFTEKHKIELENKFPNKKFICVDAKMFSWYGSGMIKTPDYFRLLWPENFIS